MRTRSSHFATTDDEAFPGVTTGRFTGFHVGYTRNRFGTHFDQLAQFFNFVKRTTELAIPGPTLSLDVYDSLSGIGAGAPGIDANGTVPNMQFGNVVGVTEVLATVVENHFGSLVNLLVKSPHPTFPCLNTIQLKLLPDAEDANGLQPSELTRHSLQELVKDLQEVYKDVELEEDLFGERDESNAVVKIWGSKAYA